MTQREACEAFLRGEEAIAGALRAEAVSGGAVLRSYATPIAARRGRWTYLTETRHSVTTSRHVAAVRAACERAHDPVVVGDARLLGALARLGVADLGRLG